MRYGRLCEEGGVRQVLGHLSRIKERPDRNLTTLANFTTGPVTAGNYPFIIFNMSQAAEAFFIGRIHGASGFSNGAFCRWWIAAGQQWTLVNGLENGQTQVDTPRDAGEMSIWSHPIDAHYEFGGVQGWPRISFEVWENDSLGKSFLGGYGFVVLPMSHGKHDLKVTLWKPVGTKIESWTSRYCGGAPHLRSQEIVHTPTSRYQLTSESSGTVHLTVNVILRRMSAVQV